MWWWQCWWWSHRPPFSPDATRRPLQPVTRRRRRRKTNKLLVDMEETVVVVMEDAQCSPSTQMLEGVVPLDQTLDGKDMPGDDEDNKRRRKKIKKPNGVLSSGRFFKHIPLHSFSWSSASPSPSPKGETSRFFRYRPSRFSFTSRRTRRRVVLKNGDCNVTQSNVAKRSRRFLQDIFTTLVDIKWRWTLLVFSLSFILSWLSFAGIWWVIMFAHGDLQPDHLPNDQEASGWTPCVTNIFSFASCFLFSIETQHTIGYGSRYTTEQCPEAIFVMCVQSITGVIIQALMVGIVFAKISRPKKRTQTLLFSRNAVICQRDGQLCLQFRVGDMRKSHIIEAHVRAQLIKRRLTREGEVIPFYQHEMQLGGEGADDRIFFIWPTTIVHVINEDSPLYTMSASDLMREKFELVVILEGVIESTGMTTQARRSYLPNEILWGHRFDNILSFKKDVEQFAVDYSVFHNSSEVDTPLCSQKDLDDLRRMQQEDPSLGPPSQFCLQVPPSPFGHSDISMGSSDRLSAMSSPSTLRTVDDEAINNSPNEVHSSGDPANNNNNKTVRMADIVVDSPLQTRF